MSGSVNKVILIGHLGKDPEMRTTQAGTRIAQFRMATSEAWRDKTTGERKERTEWHTIVVFNEGLAKIAEQYLRKGAKVYVEGELATRKWQAQDGSDRYSTEVVLKAYRGSLTLLDKSERSAPEPESYGTTRTDSASGAGLTPADLDDEIPY